ncbi:MAG: Ig-like domain-containing protein [Flavobacteriales bacterium]
MKKNLLVLRWAILSFALIFFAQLKAQNVNAGKSISIINNLSSSQKNGSSQSIPIGNGKSLLLNVNVVTSEQGNTTIIGNINNESNATFHLHGNATNLKGSFILKDKKQAYQFTTDANGNAIVSPINIDNLICTEYQHEPYATKNKSMFAPLPSSAVNDLQSLPGAGAVVLLDFDGQVVSGTYWNGGNTINAAPSGFDNNTIEEIWEMISEDFRPFALNITTNEAVYSAAHPNQRMRVIFTPTNTAAPGSGGVAYIGSFTWGNETPCWVFNGGVKGAGEAGSHEIGHTMYLYHDGRTNPSETYYAGHGDWAPIMGVGYYRNVVQFSKGEYPYANNSESDIAVIAGNNGFTYRNDDFGNTANAATEIDPDHNGLVNISGIIEWRTDLDVFSFHTSGGNLNLDFNPATRHGNLNISVTLKDINGYTYATVNPNGLAAPFSIYLQAGTYFIFVDGAGEGDVNSTGYSDYGSVGTFNITGSVPPYSNTNQAPIVSIINPTSGQNFTVNQPFDITATASDPDGSITKVEFYVGSILVATRTMLPYSINYTPTATGTLLLTVKAYDNGTPVLSTVSSIVPVNVLPGESEVCTGSAANGDYTYEVGKINGVSTIKFIPGASITGCNAALIYYKVDNGPIMGSYMEASGSNFVKTYSAPAGSVVTFYFTYRIGNTNMERNSSANPHSITEGNCNGAINNPSGCTGSAANGDYTFEATSSNGITSIKFIPSTPIAGCNMAIIYYKIGNGGLAGYYMDAAGTNFTKSFAAPTGSTVTFYFTYRVGTTGVERNSSASPHSFIVGNCGLNAQAGEATTIETLVNETVLIYPNPAQNEVNIKASDASINSIIITDLFNRVVVQQETIAENATLKLNVSSLENGIYFAHLKGQSNEIVKTIVVEK